MSRGPFLKLITLISLPTSGPLGTTAARALYQHALAVCQPTPLRYTANLAGVRTTADPSPGRPPYDAVEELWFGADADPEAVAAALAPSPAAHRIVYHVSERIQLDVLDRGDGQPSPGVKAIYLVRRRAGLSDEEAKQRWREHAGTALEHHAGMARYVQNGVVAPLTAGAPRFDGIAILHFPALQDLEERMYDSEQGRAAVAADVAGLVESTIALYTTEYAWLGRT